MASRIGDKERKLLYDAAKMSTGGGVKYRISIVSAILLVLFAGFFDILSLIPFVGDFVGPLFWVVASLYFWKIGLGIVNGRRLAVGLISMIAELIPVVQEFPSLMVGISAVIIMTRIEDKTGLSLNPLKKPGVTEPRIQRQPLNSQEGVRPPRLQRKDNSVDDRANFPLDAGEIA